MIKVMNIELCLSTIFCMPMFLL